MNLTIRQFKTISLLGVLLANIFMFDVALALAPNDSKVNHENTAALHRLHQNAESSYEAVNGSYESVLVPLRHTQSTVAQYRSKKEVVQEVKRRSNAKVLKITLNKKTEMYRVRVLMPSGKVRLIRVSAKRSIQ